MKSRIERAARRGGLSVNSWLQRVASAALEEPGQRERHGSTGGERYAGWVR